MVGRIVIMNNERFIFFITLLCVGRWKIGTRIGGIEFLEASLATTYYCKLNAVLRSHRVCAYYYVYIYHGVTCCFLVKGTLVTPFSN